MDSVYPQSFPVNCYLPTSASHPENWETCDHHCQQVESEPVKRAHLYQERNIMQCKIIKLKPKVLRGDNT